MELKTKFNVGDEIFYMKNNKIAKAPIKEIHIVISELETYVKYKIIEESKTGYTSHTKYVPYS